MSRIEKGCYVAGGAEFRMRAWEKKKCRRTEPGKIISWHPSSLCSSPATLLAGPHSRILTIRVTAAYPWVVTIAWVLVVTSACTTSEVSSASTSISCRSSWDASVTRVPWRTVFMDLSFVSYPADKTFPDSGERTKDKLLYLQIVRQSRPTTFFLKVQTCFCFRFLRTKQLLLPSIKEKGILSSLAFYAKIRLFWACSSVG